MSSGRVLSLPIGRYFTGDGVQEGCRQIIVVRLGSGKRTPIIPNVTASWISQSRPEQILFDRPPGPT